MTNDVNNNEATIDSRDVIARIEELESDLETVYDDAKEEFREQYDELVANKEIDEEEIDFDEWVETKIPELDEWVKAQDSEDANELKILKAVAEEGEGYGDWNYGATLIRESYFTKYCEELCKDIGDVPRNMPSYIEIDWEATAENLKADYTEITFDGVTYYMRA